MVSAQISPLPVLLPLSMPASPPPPTIPSSSSLPLAFAALNSLLCITAAVIGPSPSLDDLLKSCLASWWSAKIRLRRIPVHRTAAPYRRTGYRLEHPALPSVSDPDPPDCSRSAHPPACWLRLCTGLQSEPDLGEVQPGFQLPFFRQAGIPSHKVGRAILQVQADKPSRAGLLLQPMKPNSYPKTLLGWSSLLCRWRMGWTQLLIRRKMGLEEEENEVQFFEPVEPTE